MVDARGEVHFGRFEWVVGREVDGQEEDTTRVRTLPLIRISARPFKLEVSADAFACRIGKADKG